MTVTGIVSVYDVFAAKPPASVGRMRIWVPTGWAPASIVVISPAAGVSVMFAMLVASTGALKSTMMTSVRDTPTSPSCTVELVSSSGPTPNVNSLTSPGVHVCGQSNRLPVQLIGRPPSVPVPVPGVQTWRWSFLSMTDGSNVR